MKIGNIRQQGGNSKNPTSIQFARAFKKSFSAKYLEHITTGNCQPQKSFNLNSSVTLDMAVERKSIHSLGLPNDVKTMGLGEQNAFTYFIGYLIKKSKERHSCTELITNETPDLETTFIGFKQQEGCKLNIPSAEMVEFAENLENEFCKYFNMYLSKSNIEELIYTELKKIEEHKCCSLFNKEYFIRLFIRVRIFYVLKFFNIELNERKNKQKLLNVSHL